MHIYKCILFLLADLKSVVIKEEPVSLCSAEIEAARIKVENLSFISHRLSFQYECNNCYFSCIERAFFEDHIKMHNDLKWTGFCSTCDAHIIGYDASLVQEYSHMVAVHVREKDIITLQDEINTNVYHRPILKLKSLDGDYLSKKNM